MQAPIITIDGQADYVCNLIAPSTGGNNVQITEYEVLILNKQGEFEIPVECQNAV
jgi:hypothetical protein